MSLSLRNRSATWTSAIAAALAGVLFIASPAQAEGEVDVEISGLADDIRAGEGRSDDFRVVFTNTSGEAVSGVFTVITVSLAGAPTGAIYVQRGGGELRAEAAGEGTVAFTDPAPFDLGRGRNGRRRIDFLISFGGTAPEGEAAITVAAYAGGELLGRADASIQVRGGTGHTSAPNTDPGIVPTFTAGPTYSIAPLTDAAAATPGGSTVPKTMYVLGSLLVAIGLMTLVLILRPPGARLGGAAPQRGTRRPMVWPGRPRPADGSRYPRPAQPGALRAGAPGQWPAVAAPPPPALRPDPPRRGPGPHSMTGRVRAARPVRDPAPDDRHWRYD